MLSNLLITSKKFVLIVDSVGQERIAISTINGLLKEQGQEGSSLLHLKKDVLSENDNIINILNQCSEGQKKSVVLPTLSDFLVYNPKKAFLFNLIHKLKLNSNVKQIFLWATKSNIPDTFTIACLEYMADMVLYIESKDTLSIWTKKAGKPTYNSYNYIKTKNSFEVSPVKKTDKIVEKPAVKPEQIGTFKIELEEEELVARNAIKMPYEKTSEAECSGGGNIIYTPDKDDDFDEEDPDDDLYI